MRVLPIDVGLAVSASEGSCPSVRLAWAGDAPDAWSADVQTLTPPRLRSTEPFELGAVGRHAQADLSRHGCGSTRATRLGREWFLRSARIRVQQVSVAAQRVQQRGVTGVDLAAQVVDVSLDEIDVDG